MSRLSSILSLAVFTFVLASCGSKAVIDVTVQDAPSTDIVVKLLDVNKTHVLDTVKTDESGKFTYKVELEKNQPDFVYLFHNDNRIASLILKSGDKVAVEADTLGNYSVEGSEESEKLIVVENNYTAAVARMVSASDKLDSAKNPEEALQIRQELGQIYIDYYRDCVRYIIDNSHSLSVIPVLYQNFGENLPVFSQNTDALHFNNMADSLEMDYPESKYVKALRQEAKRRQNYLEFEYRLNSAQEIGFPDIELPDINAQMQKLSEVDAKVIMLYFWSASDVNQKMFNMDFIRSVYDDYHKKGFEIYQVSLDADKTFWAQVMKEQKLPWINVCDSRGSNSPYVVTYNLTALPAVYIISDGELVDGELVDEKSFRKLLNKLLK